MVLEHTKSPTQGVVASLVKAVGMTMAAGGWALEKSQFDWLQQIGY